MEVIRYNLSLIYTNKYIFVFWLVFNLPGGIKVSIKFKVFNKQKRTLHDLFYKFMLAKFHPSCFVDHVSF